MIFKKLLDSLYPPQVTCAVCDEELKDEKERERCLCGKCLESFCYIGGSPIKIRRGEVFSFSELYSLYIYEGGIRKLVLGFKDNGKIYLAEFIAKHLFEELTKCANLSAFDAISYIPTAKQKIRKRGYDSMREIAKHLSLHTGIPVGEYLGKRDTLIDQTEAQNRYLNIKDAFFITKSPAGKRLLLIDDIFNSGATLSEAGKLLSKNGATVTAMTFCISPTFAKELNKK